MKVVKVLGTGCPKCNQLLAQTEAAVAQLGIECEIEKVTDLLEITSYGVMMTPALLIDGEIKSYGLVPSLDELKTMLK